MKVAICQINSIVGGCSENADNILNTYYRSIKYNPDIVIFPELCITGYPPQDLLFDRSFIKYNLECVEKIRKKSTIPIIIGFAREDKDGMLYNSAAVCYDGRLQNIYDKTLLPTYDVFDETRYFRAGKNKDIISIPIKNRIFKIGLQICEDLWDSKYDFKVTKEQNNLGAELFINISSSPFSTDKIDERMKIIKQKVKTFKKPLNIPLIFVKRYK